MMQQHELKRELCGSICGRISFQIVIDEAQANKGFLMAAAAAAQRSPQKELFERVLAALVALVAVVVVVVGSLAAQRL